jgi:hypothetical protein
LIVFLLLGAIVNVAVAWGLAVRRAFVTIERFEQGHAVIWNQPMQFVQERRFGMIDVWWYDLYDENPRSTTPEQLVAAGEQRLVERLAAGQTMPSGRSAEGLTRIPQWGSLKESRTQPTQALGGDIAFGWPMVCLWMTTTGDVIANTTANEHLHGAWLLHGGIETRANNFIALPYRPLWMNLVMNTVFYAFMLWAIFAFPVTFRRRRRIARRLCPACAYPVGVSPVCTECGVLLPEGVVKC